MDNTLSIFDLEGLSNLLEEILKVKEKTEHHTAWIQYIINIINKINKELIPVD